MHRATGTTERVYIAPHRRSTGARPQRRRNPVVAHAASVVWLLISALVYLAPALSRGVRLGDYELLSIFGFTSQPGVPVHNAVSSDQIQEMIPWNNLTWLQVHAGHLPMWNPFAGLGLPLAFNFQSAPFSLTTAVSYLFPLALAYTVTVVAKLVIAGVGVMFLLRTLGVGVIPATVAGTVFELSGAYTAWSGWPHDGVYCWLGWTLGAITLLAARRRVRLATALLAVSVALGVLGGHPESIIISLVVAAIYALALLVVAWVREPGVRTLLLAGQVTAAAVAGLALSAPVLAPGLQVISRSSHTTATGYAPLPLTNLANLAYSTFYGLPILHQTYFGSRNYYVAASYVGFGALCLAVLALVTGWRRAEVRVLGILALVCGAIVYSTNVARFLERLPGAKLVLWDRTIIPLSLIIAVLAGIGLETLIRRGAELSVRVSFAGVAVAAAVVEGAVVLASRSGRFHSAQMRQERLHSLLVPGLEVGVGLVAAVLLLSGAGWWKRAGAVSLVVGAEVLFLFTATPSLWSSSPTGFPTTAAASAYEATVGAERVGFAACPSLNTQASLGVLAEANSAYGVAEFAAYDPVVPKTWFQAYGAAIGQPDALAVNNFCGSVDSVAVARQFGIGFVLVPPTMTAPAGMLEAARISGVGVYRVPGSGIVTEGPADAPVGAAGRVIAYSAPDPASLHLVATGAAGAALRFHITNLPGWHATVDDRAVPVRTFDATMMQIDLGPGRHKVTLTYDPSTWTLGLWVCLAAAALLTAGLAAGPLQRRFGRYA